MRYLVILNYESIFNNERKATILGAFANLIDAKNKIAEDIAFRRKSAKEYNDGEITYESQNVLQIGINGEYARFAYDIHDLCAEDWSCEESA